MDGHGIAPFLGLQHLHIVVFLHLHIAVVLRLREAEVDAQAPLALLHAVEADVGFALAVRGDLRLLDREDARVHGCDLEGVAVYGPAILNVGQIEVHGSGAAFVDREHVLGAFDMDLERGVPDFHAGLAAHGLDFGDLFIVAVIKRLYKTPDAHESFVHELRAFEVTDAVLGVPCLI